MKTIGFIGAYDKIDLIIYIAKVLSGLNKKVLIIDSTILQRAKYIVPSISPSKTYITEFEKIDVAVGLRNYSEIKDYLGIPQHAILDYDYILIDVDNSEALEKFDIKSAYKNYFVTGFDLYSLKRGLEIISGISEPMKLTKILYSKDMIQEEEDYLNYLSLGYKVIWDDERIYFPFEQGDKSIIIENQRVAKVKLKKLSEMYKESLLYIIEEITEKKESSNVRKIFKQLEKGV